MSSERDNFRISCVVAISLAIITAQFDYGNCEDSSEYDKIFFRLYTSNSLLNYTDAYVGNAADLVTAMNASKPTVFYLHGWTENVEDGSSTVVVPAYLQRNDHNVIAVDYSVIADSDYITAASAVPSVGQTIADALQKMMDNGLDYSTIHLVGHSLGAQVSGFIGRNSDFPLPRITGLDPAGPGFYIVQENLEASDATFVDIISTDSGFYGSAESQGTVHFHPNGGTRYQPGCTLALIPSTDEDYCNHHRSYEYYAESLLNEDAFPSVQCSSHLLFSLGLCSDNEQAVMGYGVSTKASGNFYLSTNSKSPYGMGT